MKRMKLSVAAMVALLGISLAGCMFITGPTTGSIEGVVTDAGAGAPVVGARVVAFPADGSPPKYWVDTDYFSPVAVTDSEGRYKLVVPKGEYIVEATKDGFAGSRVEGVIVGSTTVVHLIQKPVFNPQWSVEPPKVTLWIEDPHDAGTGAYTGPIDFRVDALSDNDISSIYAAVGKTPGAGFTTGYRLFLPNTYTTGDIAIDPGAFGVEGWTTFEVVVYDQNENRTHLMVPVYIAPQAGVPLQPAPAISALAVTISKQLGFYNQPLTVPAGSGDLELQAAPPGANLYVELDWLASPDDAVIGGVGLTGYRIYRRLQGEPDYRQIATLAQGDGVYHPDTNAFLYYRFRDSCPELKEGLTAYYQVRAYMGDEESAAVEASTRPLGTWDVRLISPGQGEVGVSTTPTFTWEPTRLVGNDQVYMIWVQDFALGYGAYYEQTPFINVTECTWDDLMTAFGLPKEGTPFERLQPHRIYDWYIDYAIAYDDLFAPSAISVAIGGPLGSAPTDRFTFTTGEE